MRLIFLFTILTLPTPSDTTTLATKELKITYIAIAPVVVISAKKVYTSARKMTDFILKEIIHKESKNNPNAVGDTHLKTPSIGILQIRIPCLQDVNKTYLTNYHPDDRYDPEKSKEIFHLYLKKGIKLFREKYGKNPTEVQLKAMWNGGIYGGYLNPQALSYARK